MMHLNMVLVQLLILALAVCSVDARIGNQNSNEDEPQSVTVRTKINAIKERISNLGNRMLKQKQLIQADIDTGVSTHDASTTSDSLFLPKANSKRMLEEPVPELNLFNIARLVNAGLGVVGTNSVCYGGEPSRAIDGDNSDQWVDSSITHSCYEDRPWWKVEFYQQYEIFEIKVWNRMDCCSERLNGAEVQVSVGGDPIYSQSLETMAGIRSKVLSIPNGVMGDKVSVRLTGSNWLSLAEVEVLGVLPNIALLGSTSQSSTYDSPSSLAIDEDTSGLTFSCAFPTQTGTWWKVDLHQLYVIFEIRVYNRIGNGSERLNGAIVEVLDESENVVYSHTLETTASTVLKVLSIPDGVVGKEVSVRKIYKDFLCLAEVEVYGGRSG